MAYMFYEMNNKLDKKEIVGITLDGKTKARLDKYAEDHSISRSATIRIAVNEFFMTVGDTI